MPAPRVAGVGLPILRRGLERSTRGCGGPASAQPSADAGQSGRPRVVVLGDSLTAGLGLLENQAYPALLQQKIDADGYDYEVENAGVSGDTSAGGLRRLDWALAGERQGPGAGVRRERRSARVSRSPR